MPVTTEPSTGPHRQDQPRFSTIRTISGTLSSAFPFYASQAICVSSYGGSSDSCLHPLPIHILDPGEPDGAAELRARMPEDVAGGSLRKPGVLQLVADEDGVGA